MLYMHEQNINHKISSDDFARIKAELIEFKENVYNPMRKKIDSFNFSVDIKKIQGAVDIFNSYRNDLHSFAKKHSVKSQSKFESTFLEEISCYLFKNLDEIKTGQLEIYNKGVFAGLKINNDFSILPIKKDVDFCIGKKIVLSIVGQEPIDIIVPVISVEVKTYLDKTMLGEIKSSSGILKSSTPNSKTYVLMGYKNIADEAIIAAKQDSVLDEMFVLQAQEKDPIDAEALLEYYKEITSAIKTLTKVIKLNVPGRLFKNM